LRGAGRLGPDVRLASVMLREPPKDAVLDLGLEGALPREALVVSMDSSHVYQARIDLGARRIAMWRELAGVQPNLVASEFEAASRLMLSDLRVVAALAKRGITQLDSVVCRGGSPGYFGTTEERGRRLMRADCADRRGVHNAFGRPIGGLTAVIDVRAGRVLRVIDTGPVPMPSGAVDFDSMSVGRLRDTLPKLIVSQPNGAGFHRDGNVVTWDRWRFHVRTDPRLGLVLSTVAYRDNDRWRSVMYQGSLSEIFVPYMDPGEGWYHWTYLDLGEYTSSGFASTLHPGTDCPAHAAYFDLVMADERGESREQPRVACLFEREAGELAWRHAEVETGVTESRPRRDLVLRMIATLENYDYIVDWIFERDGTIRVSMGATGIVAAKAVPQRDATSHTGSNSAAGDRHGRFVADHTIGVNHDHFFCFRLDLDVDGQANSFVVNRLETTRTQTGTPRTSVWVARERIAKREREAQLEPSVRNPELWRVVNPGIRNEVGYPVGYQIKAEQTALPLLSPDDFPQRRAGFTAHSLWITPYRADERFAAGEFPTQSRGGEGLPTWTGANRAIENTDIVAWYVLGLHHLVRAEDWPVMPVAWYSFEIRPFDFFSRNPGLDIRP
jgi:primary-amine oxidase